MTTPAHHVLIPVPYLLDFAAPTPPGGFPSFRPGRGRAGWTVTHVSIDRVGDFLAALPPAAWMPGTHRALREHAAREEARIAAEEARQEEQDAYGIDYEGTIDGQAD